MTKRDATPVSYVGIAAFVLLFAGTFAALFYAQKVKSTPSLIEVRRLPSRNFSPFYANPRRRVSRFSVWLREPDDITVGIFDSNGREVRRLGSNIPVGRYHPKHFKWDGRADNGKLASNGLYRVHIELARHQRSLIVAQTTELRTHF